MADTTFANGTVVQPAWLNDANSYIYRTAPNIFSFGAVGDGTTDDTAALNLAGASGQTVLVPPNYIFTTTTGVSLSPGTKFRGHGNWIATGRINQTLGVSTIKYTGAGGANSYVVKASTQPVGTMPTSDLMNVGMTHITLDGGYLAEYGLYGSRFLSNNQFDYITVTRTVKHGFWANICFNGTIVNWMAFLNQGAGITLGADTFSWGSAAFDECVVISPFGYFNGANGDSTLVSYYNQFNELSNPSVEYGIGYFGGRGTVFVNPQGARNGGAGFYTELSSLQPGVSIGGYFEFNGRSSGSTMSWNAWLNTSVGANNGLKLDSMHFGGTSVPTSDQSAIRITGTAPSRSSGALKFIDMPVITNIKSDYRNYRLIDCDPGTTFLDQKPFNFRGQYNGNRNLDTIGTGTIDGTGGTLSILDNEGLFASAVYTSTGVYAVTLDETFSSARYIIQCTAQGAGRIAGYTSPTGSTFNVVLTDSAGTPVDGRVSVSLTGYYTQ